MLCAEPLMTSHEERVGSEGGAELDGDVVEFPPHPPRMATKLNVVRIALQPAGFRKLLFRIWRIEEIRNKVQKTRRYAASSG